jgi:hypothetical protein
MREATAITGSAWMLVATKSNPGAVGAIISWEAGGKRWRRLKTAGGSFLASHDPREILGVGDAAKVDSVEIKWPSGRLTSCPIFRPISTSRLLKAEGLPS